MRSHLSFWYCLFCWSNWIPSVAYNESSLDLFSPFKYLFLLNAGFPWITSPNLKTCICPLAPVIDLFFFSFFSLQLCQYHFYSSRGLKACFYVLFLPRERASSSGHSPHSANWLLICQMHFKVKWKSRTLFEVICEGDTPTCIAVITHPSFALDSWPLLMQRKLCCSTGSSAPVRHLKRQRDDGGVLACTPWFFQRSLNPASPRDLHGEHLSRPLIHTANTSRKVALTERIEGKDFFNYSPAAEWKGTGFTHGHQYRLECMMF